MVCVQVPRSEMLMERKIKATGERVGGVEWYMSSLKPHFASQLVDACIHASAFACLQGGALVRMQCAVVI